MCDHTDKHRRACDCPVRFRGEPDSLETGLPRLLVTLNDYSGAVRRMTAWGLFEISDIDPSAGASGPKRTLGIMGRAAVQLSHCCHSCIAQHSAPMCRI
jgi:hypothetical protein